MSHLTGSSRIIVEVETSPGSGTFAADGRLRADRVELCSDDGLATAQVAVRLGDDFDAIDAVQRYHPDCRIVVRADDTDAGRALFDGYPLVRRSLRDGNPDRPRDEFTLSLTSVYARLATDERRWVYGRRMRNGAILDGLATSPQEFASKSVLVEGLPCVFNLDGLPNQAAEPIVVTDLAGKTRRIHIFTYDGDPGARSWSLLDALRYLVWFHHLPEGPVSVREVLDMTEAGAGVDPRERPEWVPASAVVARLARAIDELNCEATSLVEALALLADACGLHVTCRTDAVDGRPHSWLDVWAAQDGPAKTLALAWGGRYADGTPRYATDAMSPREVFSHNQLSRVELSWDHQSIVNAPIVVGGVKRFEMTVELVPGWRPEVDLDNVAPPDREAAKLLAMTPDEVEFYGEAAEDVQWFRWYHRWGSEFEAHRDVARLWVLNEDGAFDGATYNRNSPFDEYQPFDFAQVGGAEVTRRGLWSRRPRPMLAPLTLAADGSPLRVQVEVSYDGGATWHAAVSPVTVLTDRAGVWFGLANPTAMIPPDGDWYETNMWYALIDQLFRVRATGVFESDERLIGRGLSGSGRTPTVWRRSRLVYSPSAYGLAKRSAVVDVLAGGDAEEVDDAAAIKSAAMTIASVQGEAVIRTEATIPWLDAELRIGDGICGIRGRDVATNGVVRAVQAAPPAWCVVGLTYDMTGGAAETRLQLARVDRGEGAAS